MKIFGGSLECYGQHAIMEDMSNAVDILGLYLHLARASEARRRPHVRDRLLVIAAANAARLGLGRIAAYCRDRILQHNPHHVIGRWDTVEAAMDEPEFLYVLRVVQRRYPQEKAEILLDSLGVERGCERDAYFTDEEYAAGVLGIPTEALDDLYGPEQL